jgi:hypothetical protein
MQGALCILAAAQPTRTHVRSPFPLGSLIPQLLKILTCNLDANLLPVFELRRARHPVPLHLPVSVSTRTGRAGQQPPRWPRPLRRQAQASPPRRQRQQLPLPCNLLQTTSPPPLKPTLPPRVLPHPSRFTWMHQRKLRLRHLICPFAQIHRPRIIPLSRHQHIARPHPYYCLRRYRMAPKLFPRRLFPRPWVGTGPRSFRHRGTQLHTIPCSGTCPRLLCHLR